MSYNLGTSGTSRATINNKDNATKSLKFYQNTDMPEPFEP